MIDLSGERESYFSFVLQIDGVGLASVGSDSRQFQTIFTEKVRADRIFIVHGESTEIRSDSFAPFGANPVDLLQRLVFDIVDGDSVIDECFIEIWIQRSTDRMTAQFGRLDAHGNMAEGDDRLFAHLGNTGYQM